MGGDSLFVQWAGNGPPLSSWVQIPCRQNFNCDSFLSLMRIYQEKAQNQEGELRAPFWVFDKESKGCIY